MFFEEELINKGLMCPMCKKKLEQPVSLPCADIVCNLCIISYIKQNKVENNDRFKCCFCDEDHLVPVKGFPRSKSINFLLELKPKKIGTSSFVVLFKEDLEKCMREISKIKDAFNNREEIVNNYIESRRQHVRLVTESRIDEINKRSKELLEELDEYEEDYLENLKSNLQPRLKIVADVTRAEEFCKKWIGKLKLKALELNEWEAKKVRFELDHHLKLIQIRSLHQRNYIFNEQFFKFVENMDASQGSLLGDFVFDPVLSRAEPSS